MPRRRGAQAFEAGDARTCADSGKTFTRSDGLMSPVNRGNDVPALVLVIADHELFSSTLCIALRGEGLDARTLPIVNVPDLRNRPADRPAGLVVLDLDLGGDEGGSHVTGVDLVKALQALRWRVLVVSGSADRPTIAAATAAGAIGAVPKSRSFETLLQIIVDAAQDTAASEREQRRRLVPRDRCEPEERALSWRFNQLTRREREVLELLAAGSRAAAIAEQFAVSTPTVRTQIRSALAKLEVGSQVEAVALLQQLPSFG